MSENRVLVIEDETMVQYLWQDVCDILDYPIAGQAETLAQARSLLEKDNFDIVILDVNLGSENTLEIAKRLMNTSVKVAVSTGSHEGDLAPAYHSFEILSKPFNTTDMIAMLEKLAK